jgi:hypothetical protein
MRIELRTERPPAGPDELAAAERELAELGRRIPDSYKAFLADQDGGYPVRGRFAFREGDRANGSRVKLFFGVGEQPDGDLVGMAGLAMGLPAGLLAIGMDSFGNLVCLRDDGPVVFEDHEVFDEDEPDAGGIYPIAPDLPAFLEMLHANPVPAPRPPQKNWLSRLFGRG